MIINSRYATTCTKCKGSIAVGEKVVWVRTEKGVYHADSDKCAPPAEHFQGLTVTGRFPTKPEYQNIPAPPPIDYSMKPLADVMQAVGLKRPSLRLNSSLGEVVLTLTRSGVAPGSVAIKIAGNFIGCVRPSGECSSLLRNQNYADLRTHLLSIANDKNSLIAAALDYAKLTNNCSFCGLELTNDFSVLNGYGPICAENWGLPHALNGTADKIRIPGMSDEKHMKYMKMLVEDED